MNKTLLISAILLFSNLAFASRKEPDYFDVLHYRFDVFLNDSTDIVEVQAIIKVAFPSLVNDQLTLDLHNYSKLTQNGMKVRHVLIHQQTTHFVQAEEELIIDIPHHVKIGDTLDIAMSYRGVPEDGLIISKNKYGERTFFTDHWPERAHYWLPVVDHPSEKATCEFRVSTPAHYKVIANGRLLNDLILEKGYHQVHWLESNPIPVKVMAMGAADFVKIPLDKGGFSTAWVYKTTGGKAAIDFKDATEIYELFNEKMKGFPFGKLDHVESTTLFAGMENAGNIFYDEKAITGEGKIGGLIAHEIGHQWFGNAVTEATWNDLWLSESFAEYFEYYFIEKKYGLDSLQKAMINDEKKIERYEAQFPDLCVRLKRVDIPKNILSPLVYEKGARILRMLNYRVGEEVFWQILRTYYETYKYGTARTKDFISIAEKVYGKDLQAFFAQWLDVPGKPKISYTYQKKGNNLELTLVQHTENLYDLHLDIVVKREGEDLEWNNYSIEDKETVITLRKVTHIHQVTIDPLNIIYGDISIR